MCAVECSDRVQRFREVSCPIPAFCGENCKIEQMTTNCLLPCLFDVVGKFAGYAVTI